MLKELNGKMQGGGSVHMRTINTVAGILAAVLALLLLRTTSDVSRSYQALEAATDQYITCSAAAEDLKEGSDYLTTQVRMFAITHDPVYLDQFFTEVCVTQRRERALETLSKYLDGVEAQDYLDRAMAYSNELIGREYYSLRLVAEAAGVELSGYTKALEQVILSTADAALSDEQKFALGTEMVTDEVYRFSKEHITENVRLCISALTSANLARQQELGDRLESLFLRQNILAVALLLLVVLVIGSVVFLILMPLKGFVPHIAEHQPLMLAGADELRYLAKAYNRMYEENERNSAELRYQAEHDALTGLFNRGAFEKLRETHQDQIALLIIDVDHFKGFNDTYGHEMGDAVLRKVSALLKSTFRTSDYPCRIGGDEFAVIMTGMSPALKRVIEGKVAVLRAGLGDISDGLPPVALSIGVAFSDSPAATGDIFKDADMALYVVKDRGRNGIAFFGEK